MTAAFFISAARLSEFLQGGLGWGIPADPSSTPVRSLIERTIAGRFWSANNK